MFSISKNISFDKVASDNSFSHLSSIQLLVAWFENVALRESKYDILGVKRVGIISLLSCANITFDRKKPRVSKTNFFMLLYVFAP
jgi:hypothetical protein